MFHTFNFFIPFLTLQTSIISMVFSQSEMMQKDVFLFERIDGGRSNERMKYLKCIVFLRPTSENIARLCTELENPKYGSYYLYFSNVLPRTDVKLLAEKDQSESVREIKEVYADYLAVNKDLFSLNIPTSLSALTWIPSALNRTVDGIISILLALKVRPTIRYRSTSTPAQTLGKKIYDMMNKETALFSFRPPDDGMPPPLLLILDRRDDPVTPLLNQWTYQAMVHELLTINNNRVDLSKVKDVPKELKEVVLSADQDEVYAKNLYANFGEIASVIKTMMDEFQVKAKDQRKIESIADMKNFVETYPQFKKMSGTVTKHLVVISELSLQVNKQNLFEISELEQEIACRSDHSAQLQRVTKLIADENVSLNNALRLVLLYALRYERHANCGTAGLLQKIKARGGKAFLVPRILEYVSQSGRQDLFDITNLSDAVKMTRQMLKGLKGVENVYTQHNCLLKEVLDEVFKGRPLDPHFSSIGNQLAYRRPPQEVIVFTIGGVTYEEAYEVHKLNQAGYKVILGGTTIHNSHSFLNELLDATNGIQFKHNRLLQAFHSPEGV